MGRHIDVERLPLQFPTHGHKPEFWEILGRAIATFGFLEWSLKRAIFALTGSRPAPEGNTENALKAWEAELESMLSDQLGKLVQQYDRAYRGHPGATLHGFDELIAGLSEARDMRNVFAHAHWPMPDDSGRVTPQFVKNKKLIFSSSVDKSWLDQTQKGTSELACAVISSVTRLGLEFPGAESLRSIEGDY